MTPPYLFEKCESPLPFAVTHRRRRVAHSGCMTPHPHHTLIPAFHSPKSDASNARGPKVWKKINVCGVGDGGGVLVLP